MAGDEDIVQVDESLFRRKRKSESFEATDFNFKKSARQLRQKNF